MKKYLLLAFTFVSVMIPSLHSEILSSLGSAFLKQEKGQTVLHVKGSPYEMGYQHGKLLKDQVQRNIQFYIDKTEKNDSVPAGRVKEFLQHIPQVLKHTPERFIEEMKGLAEGAEVPFEKIVLLNLFPEMFHCSGITARKEASHDGSLYHVRILDYSIGKNLQSTAVLIVAEPLDGISFLNVSYAGFIGSVTGMNSKKISVGEIGGQGYGYWDGIPMAFLMRIILEEAESLDQARHLLSSSPRTCEYYYVVSDGNTDDSFGCYATSSHIHFIEPGTNYAMFATAPLPLHYEKNGQHDKFFLSNCSTLSSLYQECWMQNDGQVSALFHRQPQDTLLLTGFSHPERYPVLTERIVENYGRINAVTLMEIIKQPVSRESNLHNAIFHPSTLEIWIAHAGPNNEPACDQPYSHFSMQDLLSSQP
jgi:isopenicillin-N N-acyltransferase like protein